jgi:hypothetical protein
MSESAGHGRPAETALPIAQRMRHVSSLASECTIWTLSRAANERMMQELRRIGVEDARR